jgi:hypothetical protein
VAVAAGIVAVGILGDSNNSAAIVVNVADPKLGCTPCGTWEEHH